MRRIRIEGKTKGVIEVLSSHFWVLLISMLVSFILPLLISVEEYGKWQLFSLIIGYAGFFALGFNDGIHIKYSGLDYNEEFFYKFREFRRFLDLMAIVGTLLALLIIFIFHDSIDDTLIYVIAAMNIIPVMVNGFFAYVNQGTMRFHIFAKANIYEKIVYLFMMAILLVAGVKKAIYYCLTYTIARYMVIAFNCFKSKELFGSPKQSFNCLRSEIYGCFVAGFSLMLANICNQSIIVPGRLLVERTYGIVAFSCYSFAIHTMVLANQVTTALSQVFYPAMKRTTKDNFLETFFTIDRAIGLLAIVLLFSYYPVFLLIKLAYPKYSEVLDYLYCIYPLFTFTSKSAILVINTYKMEEDGKQLLLNNAFGVIINLAFVVFANAVFKSVSSIAIFTLIGYMIWYYICYIGIIRKRNSPINISCFIDVFTVCTFVVINIITNHFFNGFSFLLASGVSFFVLALVFFLSFKKYCMKTVKDFIVYMNK